MLLKRLKADLPQVEFTLSVMPHEKQIDALRSELIDIGFSRSFQPEADILIQDVLTESLLIAISTSDPLATRKTLHLVDLQRPFILFPAGNRPNFSEALLSMLAEKGIVPTVGAEVEDPSTALSLVSVGLGILVVPQSVAAIRMPDVAFIPLAESALRSVIQCAYLKNSTSKILPMFLSLIRERLNAEAASRDL
jgi:DNA-binding transcriptional LysR family regulator